MKLVLVIFGLSMTFLAYGQENKETIKVIAKFISSEQRGKICIAEYQVIKSVKGILTNDTIKVGYYFYSEYQNSPDTVLLNLTTYTWDTTVKDYYIFPHYDAKKGIEKVKISKVDFEYWEGCETGKGECNPLTFTRSSKNENWFLIMPCGGTGTSVTLSKQKGIIPENEVILKTEISYSECPPVFNLTNLTDGKYYAYMLSCGLGGQIEVNLKTRNK